MTVEINFAVDFTDPTRYTLISGLPLASFGNPSPALYGKPAKIELRLPLPGTLTFVAADFTRKQNSSLNAR